MPDIVDPTKAAPPPAPPANPSQRPDVTVETVTPQNPAGASASVPPGHQAAPPVQQAAPPAGASQEPRRVSIGADAEIPPDADILELSKAALNSRISRASKAQLKERFGIDDPDVIKAQLEELRTFKEKEEQARLASLSDLEKEREARARAEGEAAEWKKRHDDVRDAQVIRTAHGRVERLAAQHVREKSIRHAVADFGDYLRTKLSEEEINALTDEQIGGWFQDLVREDPLMGKAAAAPPPPPPPAVVPLTNGAPTGNVPPPPTAAPPSTTYSPSAPNAMSRADAAERARKEGYHY